MKRLTLSTILISLCLIPLLLKASTAKVILRETPGWIAHIKNHPNEKYPADTVSGYVLRISEEQIHLEKKVRYVRIIREIVSDAGVGEASEVYLSFNPLYQTLALHKVILWRNGVAHNRLDLNEITVEADETDPVSRKYSNQHTAYLSFKDLKIGDKLEYAYSVQGADPVFGNHIFRFIYLQSYKPERSSYTSVLCSKSRNLTFKFHNGAAKPIRKDEGELIRYEWQRRNQKALTFEEDEPEWFYPGPIVQISDYANWKEVAKMAQELMPVRPVKDMRITTLIQDLKAGENTKASLFRKAVKYVQDRVEPVYVREGMYLPGASKPGKVLGQQYGDSREKAVLLVALLRSMGINAWIALVNDNDQLKANQYLPSLSIFDRAIVKARIEGKDIWVDPCLKKQGGSNTELYFPGAENILVLDNQSDALVRVPQSRHGKLTSVERYTIHNTSSPVYLEVTSIYTLNEADYMRRSLANTPIDSVQKNYLNYYSTRYPHIKVKDKIAVRDNEQKNELRLVEHYRIDGFFNKDSVLKNYTFSFGADHIASKLLETDAARKHPIEVEFPLDIDHKIEVMSAGGWNIDTESSEIKRDGFIFRSNFYSEDELLTLHYTFTYLKDYIPANKTSEYAADVAAMKNEYLDYNVIFTPDEVPYIPNYWMVGFNAIVISLSILFARIIYKSSPSSQWYQKPTIKLGGTLILIFVYLIVTAGCLAYNLIDGKFTDLNAWRAFDSRKSWWLYKSMMVVSAFRDVFISCFAIFCALLIQKKRDILPKLIIIYLAVSSILLVLVFVLNTLVYHVGNFMWDAGYSILITLACIAYFQNSERVKQVFVVPYIKRD